MIQNLRFWTVVSGVVGACMAYAGSLPDYATDTAAWLAIALAALAYEPSSRGKR